MSDDITDPSLIQPEIDIDSLTEEIKEDIIENLQQTADETLEEGKEQALESLGVSEKIKSFELFAEEGLGDDNQENIKETLVDPKKLVEIAALREVSGVKDRQPPLAERPNLKFPFERPRVEKRNVLPAYDPKTETYTAEVIETTIDRFMTHEPCVEHIPVRFETDIDPEGVLQTLFKEKNPEEEDYLQYRNSDISGRYA